MTSAVSGMSAALYRDEPEEYVVTALGSNRDICFVSKNHAVPGIAILVAGNDTPLSVSVASSDITVNSATGSGGAPTSTAAQIVAALNAYPAAFALMAARLPPFQDGSGVTGALSHTHGANGVASAQLALADSGDHLTFQAAAGYRYWSSLSLLEVDVGHDGSWVTQSSGFTVNLLRGSITLDVALASGDLVRATVVRRSELAFRKVLLLYNGKQNCQGKEIETDNLDDSGWGSSLVGSRSWTFDAGSYYYSGDFPFSEIGEKLLLKVYSLLPSVKSFIGYGRLKTISELVANPSEAQKSDVTFSGDGEIYPE